MTLKSFDELHEKKVAALDVALTSLERANRLLCSSFLRAAIEQCNLAQAEEEADWRNYHAAQDRAAELPLERTSGTCPSCGGKGGDITDDGVPFICSACDGTGISERSVGG